jgi:hypothetical protein
VIPAYWRQARQVTLSARGEVIAYGTRSPHPVVTAVGRSPASPKVEVPDCGLTVDHVHVDVDVRVVAVVHPVLPAAACQGSLRAG